VWKTKLKENETITSLKKFKFFVDSLIVRNCYSHDNVGMTVYVLRDGMYNEVGTKVERSLEIRCHESTVNSQ
jgi:hypothetical protein